MKKTIGLPRKIAGCLLLAVAVWMIFSPTAQATRNMPELYRIVVGQTWDMDMGVAVLSSRDQRLLSDENGKLQARSTGETEVTINLFGLFPVKRVRVNVEEDTRLVPGGQAVGIALAMKGVMVVGVSDVAGQSPAKQAGLQAGDVIETVNGRPVTTGEELIAMVEESKGKDMRIGFRRNDEIKETVLKPQLDKPTGIWRIGAWVRDSTAGVGTLSYYNPQNGSYGALGHAILDADTAKLLPVRMGALMQAEIVGVKKGQKGNPGELRGSFLRNQRVLGDIQQNTVLGIYGRMDAPSSLYPDGLPVGYQESVKVGPAKILSTVDGEGVKAYDIQITHLSRQQTPSPKSMVIRVTDPDLLEKTGGIVQGMSGSPIIQNGCIIGAVTHVFVDDPTQGYGVYIEWMLETENTQAAEGNAA